jgi:hypothetical protein
MKNTITIKSKITENVIIINKDLISEIEINKVKEPLGENGELVDFLEVEIVMNNGRRHIDNKLYVHMSEIIYI